MKKLSLLTIFIFVSFGCKKQGDTVRLEFVKDSQYQNDLLFYEIQNNSSDSVYQLINCCGENANIEFPFNIDFCSNIRFQGYDSIGNPKAVGFTVNLYVDNELQKSQHYKYGYNPVPTETDTSNTAYVCY